MTPEQIDVQQSGDIELTAVSMPAAKNSRSGMKALLILASFVVSAGEEQTASAQTPVATPPATEKSTVEGTIEVTPAVRATPEFRAGLAEGKLVGRLEGVIKFLKRDMKAVSAAIEKNGSDREQSDWVEQVKAIDGRIASFEKGVAGEVPTFDIASFARTLKADVTLVNAYSLLAGRLDAEPVAAQGAAFPLQGGNFRVETGDIIALKLFKLIEPMVDEVIDNGGIRLTPRKDGAGIENPLSPTTQEGIMQVIGGVGKRIKNGIKADSDRIKAKRESDAVKRAAELQEENFDAFKEPLVPFKGN